MIEESDEDILKNWCLALIRLGGRLEDGSVPEDLIEEI